MKKRTLRKTSCISCRAEIANRYFASHKCKKTEIDIPEDLICPFCGSQSHNSGLYVIHVKHCKLNPDAKPKSEKWLQSMETKKNRGTNYNGASKAHSLGKEWLVSDETREKLRVTSSGKKHSDETKAILSRHAIDRGFGGVTQSKIIHYNGKILGSSYELDTVKSLDANGIKWDTCGKFNYTDPLGKKRTYTPDIYLIDYDVYLDPKNDFLINNINPSLGFNDVEKIKLVSEQNNITVFILNKKQLTWEYIKTMLKL